MTLKVTKVDVALIQWLVRSAYEEGYRSAKPDRNQSLRNPDKGEWFDAWCESKARKTLIDNGVITGLDSYR